LGKPIGEPAPLPGRKTILVVEDDVFIRMAIAQDLTDAGFHVIQATSGVEALRLLGSSVQVDLVSTDIHMPGGIDGIELARRLPGLRPGLKVIFLSSDAGFGRSAGLGDLWIDKPYRPSDLIGSINHLLGMPDNDRP
jgi:CheY-like chemotaxis protein